MKKWTVRQRLMAMMIILLVGVIVGAAFASLRFLGIERSALHIQKDALPGLEISSEIRSVWLTNYILTEQHVLVDERAAMQDIEARIQANRENIDRLLADYAVTIQEDQDRQRFDTLKSLRGPYLREQAALLALSVEGKDDEARASLFERLHPEFEKIETALGAIEADNKTRADREADHIVATMRQLRVFIVGGSLAVVVAVVFGVYALIRMITRPLGQLVAAMNVLRQGDFTQRLTMDRHDEFGELAKGFNTMADELTELVGQVQKAGIQVNTSITEIAATSKQQQATAGEVAATTSEIGATSKEISATSKELVKTMQAVSTVADQTATLAGGGQAGLARMEGTMREVMEAAGSINARLAVLNEKAGNINQVVTTITKVADQTNLLSLNAAIEAEKAGEYGRGFSVVATEIRRLADQTAVATYDIEQMVKDIQSAVSAGVMGMDKFSEEVRRGMQEIQQIGGQLSEIIHQAQTLAPSFETVNEGMQAQATGAEQISQALMQLSEAAQQTVESLRQSSLAIDELNQVAGTMRGSIARFKLHR